MDNPKTKMEDTANTTEKDESRSKKPQHNRKTNRWQLEEIFRLAVLQAKVWFVLSVIAAIVVFSFGMVTTATVAASIRGVSPDFNPVSLIITIATSMIETVFLVQLRGANKRLDEIRNMLFGSRGK